jgi:hypothetical protein
MAQSGIEPATLRFAAQCFNQMRLRVPRLSVVYDVIWAYVFVRPEYNFPV